MLLHEPLSDPRALPAEQAPQTPPRKSRSILRLWLASSCGALGLAIVAVSYYMERSGVEAGTTHPVFWAGLGTLIFPMVLVQLSGGLMRRQRIGMLLLAGLLLYAVKVLHDPTLFSNSDEFTHLAATQQLDAAGRLYEPLPIGGVTVASGFPGLHIVTVALSELSGLSLHTSGLVVMAVARVIFMLAVFLIAEALTKSPRTAALAAVLTTANANFIFWSSQFSYESLSLPMCLVAVYLAVTRSDETRAWFASTIGAGLIAGAVVLTHHLTSYALAATFWALTLLSVRARWRHVRSLDLALLTTGAAAAWFALEGANVGRYLGYVFRRTYTAITDAATEGTRAPFQDASGYATPAFERVIGLTAAAIASLAICWALWVLWRHPGRFSRITRLGLTLCGLAFLALFPLKAFPGAWETVNRSSNFTSIGAAVVVATALTAAGIRRPPGRLALTATAIVATIAISGAAVQGWPSRVLLSQPLEVQVADAVLRPEGFAASSWATANLPADSAYLADEVTGRELAVEGARFTLAGRADGVREVLSRPKLEPWQGDLMRAETIDFAVLDQRRSSADNVAGYFFQPSGPERMYSPSVRKKFAALPRSSRVFDSGNVVVYDIRGLRSGPADCRDLPARGLPNQPSCVRDGHTTIFADGSEPVAFARSLSLSLVDAFVERRSKSAAVTLSLQAINPDSSSNRIAPRRMRLHVGSHIVRATGSSQQVTARRRQFVRLRFHLTGAARKRLLARGAFLTAPKPGAPSVRARFDFDRRGRLL